MFFCPNTTELEANFGGPTMTGVLFREVIWLMLEVQIRSVETARVCRVDLP